MINDVKQLPMHLFAVHINLLTKAIGGTPIAKGG